MSAPKLSRRRYRFAGEFRRQYPMARAFLAPQREHPKQPMPERPKVTA